MSSLPDLKWPPIITNLLSYPLTISLFGLLSLILLLALARKRPYPNIPLISLPRRPFSLWPPLKHDFMFHPTDLLAHGARTASSCFQVAANSGYKIIIPSRFAEELKSHSDVSFNAAIARDFFVHLPGFEGWRVSLSDDKVFLQTIRGKLTQSLGLVVGDLVDEAGVAMEELGGDEREGEWVTRTIKKDAYRITARLSSRVFLGMELARNEEWLDLMERYTVDAFAAPLTLQLVPRGLVPLVHWFVPACRRLRGEIRAGRRIIKPELERRKKRAQECLARGEKPPKVRDSIGWMVELAKGRDYDYAAAQLNLGVAGIHTTSEALTQSIIRLCEHPKVVEALREEVIAVLSEDGWEKTTLYKFKLMDSFLKEVQRLEGFAMATMNRYVKKAITLSDGTVLPKGSVIMVRDDQTVDPEYYPDPSKFDPERYLQLRSEDGNGNRHQFVTTSVDNMGFGHGQHACPGRFFAAVQLKIILCFLVLQYDFSLVPGDERPRNMPFEQANSIDSNARVRMRRRPDVFDLLNPKAARVDSLSSV